jgi:uncharacterized protein (TIGR00290 family)
MTMGEPGMPSDPAALGNPKAEPGLPTPVLFCWSGGKDSALALHALRQRADIRMAGLLTTVTDAYDRISMHGVRRTLLLQQADRLGLPLAEVRIPPKCCNAVYESRMDEALRVQLAAGIRTVAFGDIFLADLRAYREQNLARLDMRAIFPLWKRDTGRLAREFWNLGFRAIVVSIDPKKLDRSCAGRELTPEFFEQLPAGVDPCGENGEFHSFVFAGPIFPRPLEIERGEVVERDGYLFCDVRERRPG